MPFGKTSGASVRARHTQFQAVPSSRHTKLSTIYLEDDTLTLWRPAHDAQQYYLIPGSLAAGDQRHVLKSFYTMFDCVTSILTFDDALPIFANQSTTLKPTDDYSVLRDCHQIQGLWFKPDLDERLGPFEQTTLGNIKLSIAMNSSEQESLFTRMNIYFLEVLDYPAEDKSVSRLLLTKHQHEEFEKYDVRKPGGPIQIVVNKEDGEPEGTVEVFYLRTCFNYLGRKWRHEVEFMMEEDPWPLCKIIPVHNCGKIPNITPARDVGASLPCRYKGATWRETLAGLFVWSLRTYIVWLVFERLHDKVKDALDKETKNVNIEDIVQTESPLVCQELFDTYNLLATFIAKCENEEDLRDLFRVFLSIHKCQPEDECTCTLVSLKTLNSAQVLPGILFLLEKVIACASPTFRYEMTSTILPWSVMGYYCSNMKITSHRKMVMFISQLQGISTDQDLESPTVFVNGVKYTTGYETLTEKYSPERRRGLSSSSRMSVSSMDSI